MPIKPKAIYKFSTVSVKIPVEFSNRNRKKNPKIRMELQKTSSSQRDLEKEQNLEATHMLI